MTVHYGAVLTDLVLPGVAPFPGAVAIADVGAPRQVEAGDTLNSKLNGKLRPVVLKERIVCTPRIEWEKNPDAPVEVRWLAWGTTTNPCHGDGNERLPATDLSLCGLRTDGYCWGGKEVLLAEKSIVGVVWAAPHELILNCALADITLTEERAVRLADQLYDAILEDHWYWPREDRWAR